MELSIANLDKVNISTLSKGQRKEYKKLKKQQEKNQATSEREKEKQRKKFIKIAIYIAIIAVVAVFFKLKSDKQKELLLNAPSLEILEDTIELGIISAGKGPVETSFTIKNTGQNNLKINNMVTSCMCTTASFIYNEKESPVFGMHNNPIGWTGEIPPGESAKLKVVYDPNFHANTRGYITRYVNFNTNDPKNKQVSVTLKTNVVA